MKLLSVDNILFVIHLGELLNDCFKLLQECEYMYKQNDQRVQTYDFTKVYAVKISLHPLFY